MHLRFDDETRAFLELPLLMRLGTIGADGFPQVTPVWFVFEDGRFITSTQKARVKYRNILRDPHVGASIDNESRPYRGLSLRGIAHLREDNIEVLVERICARYVPAEELAEMVHWVLTGQRVLIEIEPVSMTKVGAGWRGV